MEKVDKTIDAICDWIQAELKEEDEWSGKSVVGMTLALASLVEARASATPKEIEKETTVTAMNDDDFEAANEKFSSLFRQWLENQGQLKFV